LNPWLIRVLFSVSENEERVLMIYEGEVLRGRRRNGN